MVLISPVISHTRLACHGHLLEADVLTLFQGHPAVCVLVLVRSVFTVKSITDTTYTDI